MDSSDSIQSNPILISAVFDLISAFTSIILSIILAAARYTRHHLHLCFRWNMNIAVATVLTESISAALEQGSPSKLKAAKYGFVMGGVSLILCFADLAYKYFFEHKRSSNGGGGGDEGNDTNFIKNNGGTGHHCKLWIWNFADVFGLVSAVLVFLTALLHYHYLVNRKQQPMQFSVLPLAFSVCLFCSRLFRPMLTPTAISSTKLVHARCRHFGLLSLETELRGEPHGGDGTLRRIVYCPMCLTSQMHPQGV